MINHHNNVTQFQKCAGRELQACGEERCCQVSLGGVVKGDIQKQQVLQQKCPTCTEAAAAAAAQIFAEHATSAVKASQYNNAIARSPWVELRRRQSAAAHAVAGFMQQQCATCVRKGFKGSIHMCEQDPTPMTGANGFTLTSQGPVQHMNHTVHFAAWGGGGGGWGIAVNQACVITPPPKAYNNGRLCETHNACRSCYSYSTPWDQPQQQHQYTRSRDHTRTSKVTCSRNQLTVNVCTACFLQCSYSFC